MKKKKIYDPIYTRDEAADIVEMFEMILFDNDVSIPSPEDDERDPDDRLGLYGSVYYDLLDAVEDRLLSIILRRGPHGDTCKSLTEVIAGEFSGKT